MSQRPKTKNEVLREPLGVRFVRGTEGRNWACGFGALRPAGFGRDPLQPPASPLAPQGNETVQRQKPGSPDCRFFFFPGKTLPSPDGQTHRQTHTGFVWGGSGGTAFLFGARSRSGPRRRRGAAEGERAARSGVSRVVPTRGARPRSGRGARCRS